MPAKPIQWGIKIWCHAELYWLYEQFPSLHRKGGKAGTRPGLAHRMVKDLAARYHHSNMTMDNFYTSVPLLSNLAQNGVLATGTVCSNRKYLPKDLLPKSV
ncbi:hypothetical protein RRG08_026832 [Elysia crispata]|uniref:PiggyBac transposable element-derived protein domain-containing protein n=1 Tax=Elysia crispata TaxID=231223 RepID=A0AAE0YHL0_9GAST|nr:hypothetical protein RRG08_026832 [Elysia crispata]